MVDKETPTNIPYFGDEVIEKDSKFIATLVKEVIHLSSGFLSDQTLLDLVSALDMQCRREQGAEHKEANKRKQEVENRLMVAKKKMEEEVERNDQEESNMDVDVEVICLEQKEVISIDDEVICLEQDEVICLEQDGPSDKVDGWTDPGCGMVLFKPRTKTELQYYKETQLEPDLPRLIVFQVRQRKDRVQYRY